ncbi:restriction endonuclease subunit S [Ruthenibacterium lactatiformans]|uniref:restriction endonuclease subunit S n=1 Tax=Ruthenibacterium lactatiformans TaxID=1550024 RepID=UPI0032C06530
MRFNLWEDCNRVPLTELLSFIVDNRGKTVPTAPSGHKLIATNCVTNNTLFPVYDKIRYLSEETYQTWFRAHPIPGDILFVNKGTPGRVCLVPDPVDFCIAQDMIALRADESKIYPKYLFTVLRSREIQQQIYNTNVGDVIPHFKKQFLDQLLIPIPERSIQESIGDLYYVLSLKAERNKKINDNLADLLQTIYQERFVNDILAVNQGVLSDICSYSRDKVAVSELNIRTYFSTENMLSGKAGSTEATSLPTTSQTIACHKGDTLISNIRPYFKKIVYCEDKCGCSTDVLCFTPSQPRYSAYLFSTLYADKFFAFMVAGSKGTKMPRGDKQQIMTYPVVLPSEEELAGFNTIASPLLEQIYSNRAENKRLSILRDTLLPKLMSGEIDVSAVQL